MKLFGQPVHRSIVLGSMGAILALGFVGLVMVGQYVAAGMLPVVAVLLAAIDQRDARARALARQLRVAGPAEKLEVAPGDWGDLCRAVNGLVQERRLHEQVQEFAPSVPPGGLRHLLDANSTGKGRQHMVAVLLVGVRGVQHLDAQRSTTLVSAWQSLASAARTAAYEHNALLQPCGDSMMLVFGAFHEESAQRLLASATDVAQRLQRMWFASGGSGRLALGITSGPAVVTIAPGLGCSVFGGPVEQALQIERLALSTPNTRLLCTESTYHAMRNVQGAAWRATDHCISTPEGRQQVVYGWCGA